MKKLGVSVGLIVLLCCVDVNAQESMKFDNEAKKLQFIRQMLLKEEHLRLSEDSPCHCTQMMKDLLAGKNFKAIEPDVRADSMDDPRLEKWNQCRYKDYHDFPDVDVKNHFGWLPQLGAPPYRYYRIELDGNKENGPEDMIYAEYSDELSYAITGYTWVDLEKCEIKKGGGFVATDAKSHISKKPNAVYLNTLVYYSKQLWAVDFVDGFHIDLFRWIDRGRMETCGWYFFEPK